MGSREEGREIRILKRLIVWGLLIGLGFGLGAYQMRNLAFPFTEDGWVRAGYLRFIANKMENEDADARWAEELRRGGYILFVRHAQRERWENLTAYDMVEVLDSVDARETDWARAVCLTHQGIEDSKLFGDLLRRARVPVGRVLSSPSCRARETAMYAFGRIDGLYLELLHPTAINPGQHDLFAADLRSLLMSLDPGPGENVAVMAHDMLREYGKRVWDRHHIDDLWVDETGFLILKREGDELVVHYKFKSIFVPALHWFPFERGDRGG